MYQTLRNAAAGLAALVGSALISRLWLVALDAISLSNAAHGLVFGCPRPDGLPETQFGTDCFGLCSALLSHPANGGFNIVTIGHICFSHSVPF